MFSGVGFLVVAPAPFRVGLLFFPAGETKIWPGDLRVVAVLPVFCFFLDLLHIVEPRCFIMFTIYLTASLIVRTEP